MREKIVICMPVKNAENTLHKAISSVINQKDTNREVMLLIGNDNSNDNSLNIINEFLPNIKIKILNLNFGKVYSVRNFLNQYARENISNCVLIGRLDADDVLIDEYVISKIEHIFEKYNFDVLMCGNMQSKNNEVLEWENKPSQKLLDNDFLLHQLKEMSEGNPKAELPSCNTFIKPNIKIDYPNKTSAEDHWFSIFLLLQKDKFNIYIDEEFLYCIYSLDGFQTSDNQKVDVYIQSRVELYHYFQNELAK